MKWKEKLINLVLEQNNNNSNRRFHIAIFQEPFLSLILEGKKTIETRFSINRISPHGKLSKGDIVFLKKSGGPIIGYFIAGEVKYYSNLDTEKLKELKEKFETEICSYIDPNFWNNRTNSRYATLIKVEEIKKIEPYEIIKKNRNGWVVLN